MTTPMNTGCASFESLRRQVALCGVLRLPDGLPMPAASVLLRRSAPAVVTAEATVRAGTAFTWSEKKEKKRKEAAALSIIQDTDEKNPITASTSTRSDGSFYFLDLPEGAYVLHCDAVQTEAGRAGFVRLQARKDVVVNRLEADAGERTKPTVVEIVLESASPSSTGRRPAAAATEPDKG